MPWFNQSFRKPMRSCVRAHLNDYAAIERDDTAAVSIWIVDREKPGCMRRLVDAANKMKQLGERD